VLQPFAGLFGAAEMQWYLITKKIFFLVGYLRDYTLVTNMGYPTTALFAGHPSGGVAFFGLGGQELFCLGAWVAV
jgi:hypothetical protein